MEFRIQNWVSEGSYKTRIWFNKKGRSGGFYFCHELLGLGVFFVAFHSVTAFLRQFVLAQPVGNFPSCETKPPLLLFH